jgi:hypothetical protein
VLLQAGDEEAEAVTQAHAQARQQSDAEYERTAADAVTKEALTEEQAKEIQGIWRKLVRMFHPDRCMDDPEKRKAHEWLTAEINQARDRGDIQRLSFFERLNVSQKVPNSLGTSPRRHILPLTRLVSMCWRMV